MKQWMKKLVSVDAQDELVSLRASVMVGFLWLLNVCNVVLFALLIVERGASIKIHTVVIISTIQVVYIGSVWLAKRGMVDLAGTSTAVLVSALCLVTPMASPGGRACLIALIVPLFLAGIAVRPRWIVMIGVFQMLGVIGISLFVPPPQNSTLPLYFMPLVGMAIVFLTVGAIVSRMTNDRFRAKLEEARVFERLLRQDAEEASLAKSRFLASMSHELRTPLNAIIGYSEIFLDELHDGEVIDLNYTQDILRVQKAGKHLLELVSGVLDLAKVEAGQMEVSPESFDLCLVVDDLVGTLGPIAQENGNVLRTHFEVDQVRIFSDVKMCRQVVINLLSNALKFTSEGEVSVSVYEPSHGVVCVEVKDTGIGMTPEQLEHVFEEFVQADASTTRMYGGTGLGLALVKHFVCLLGASMEVSSVVGKGTTFVLVIPLDVQTARGLDGSAPLEAC